MDFLRTGRRASSGRSRLIRFRIINLLAAKCYSNSPQEAAEPVVTVMYSLLLDFYCLSTSFLVRGTVALLTIPAVFGWHQKIITVFVFFFIKKIGRLDP